MQRILIRLLPALACLALTASFSARADDKKADASGTWTWTTPGRDGGEGRKSTLKLKVEGDKVTGTISAPGRGGQASETTITDGKVKGDEVSFTVARELPNGNKLTSKYSGKLSGDSIKGKVSTEREGQSRDRDWEAKREGK